MTSEEHPTRTRSRLITSSSPRMLRAVLGEEDVVSRERVLVGEGRGWTQNTLVPQLSSQGSLGRELWDEEIPGAGVVGRGRCESWEVVIARVLFR